MTGFYIAIILFGAFISAIALVLVFADKNRAHDYRLDVTERRNALVDAMDDAETLVGEMNRFADYVATQCEDKRIEVEETIRRADHLVSQVSNACAVLESRLAAIRAEAVPTGATVGAPAARVGVRPPVSFVETDSSVPTAPDETRLSQKGENEESGFTWEVSPDNGIRDNGIHDNEMKENGARDGMEDLAAAASHRGRVLPLHSRRAEVLRLARRGMSHADIAKTLHMGKGEIELIARIGSGT